MKNKDFFYLQYNKVDWKKQEDTKINSLINNYIIDNVISEYSDEKLSVFDIGFGIGFFMEMLVDKLKGDYSDLLISGCEPSEDNFNYFQKKKKEFNQKNIKIEGHKKTFQNFNTNKKFNFITAIYVFPHFLSSDLEDSIKKIYRMLEDGGSFILVVADEEYLERKLKTEEDLFIERRSIEYNGEEYQEILHYSEIPEIGTIVDYNREERYYIDLFEDNGFSLDKRDNVDDNGFISTLMAFNKT